MQVVRRVHAVLPQHDLPFLAVILACACYPFLDDFTESLGSRIDPAGLSYAPGKGETRYVTTGDPAPRCERLETLATG